MRVRRLPCRSADSASLRVPDTVAAFSPLEAAAYTPASACVSGGLPCWTADSASRRVLDTGAACNLLEAAAYTPAGACAVGAYPAVLLTGRASEYNNTGLVSSYATDLPDILALTGMGAPSVSTSQHGPSELFLSTPTGRGGDYYSPGKQLDPC